MSAREMVVAYGIEPPIAALVVDLGGIIARQHARGNPRLRSIVVQSLQRVTTETIAHPVVEISRGEM